MINCSKRTIYCWEKPAVEGLNYRWWDSSHGPHLDPLEWGGNPDPISNFPLPTNSAPTAQGVASSSNINDSSTGGGEMRYGIIDGWFFLPDNATHLRDNNLNTGELGMVLLGSCCGGVLIEQAGGNHTASTSGTDRTILDAVPITGGWHYLYSPQSDNSAFQGLDLEYSIDGGNTWEQVGSSQNDSLMQPTAPRVKCKEYAQCSAIPDGWQIKPLRDRCQPKYISVSGSDPLAKIFGVRNEIITLRNASQLVPGATYCVTDYERGCLGAVPEIQLTAVNANTFAHDVDVLTSFDNYAWDGSYDIDTNRIFRLYDNLGNRVEGRSGTEVERFPWGNARWTENRVDNADVIVECDTEFTATNNLFQTDASVDLTGAAGAIRNSTFGEESIIQLNDAVEAVIQHSRFETRSRLYAERIESIQLYHHSQQSEAYWLARDQKIARSYYSDFGSTTRVYFLDGDEQWFYYSNIDSFGQVRQADGIMKLYYLDADSYGEVRNEDGAGEFLSYGMDLSSRAYVRNFNTNRVRSNYDSVNSRGEINWRGDTDVITYFNSITSYGRLNVEGATTVAYANRVDSQSILTLTGGNHYRNSLSNYARLTAPFNTRSVYGMGSWAQTLTAPNTNRGRDYFNNNLI